MVHLGVALTMVPTGGQRPPQPPHQSSTGCQRDEEVYTGIPGLGEYGHNFTPLPPFLPPLDPPDINYAHIYHIDMMSFTPKKRFGS